MSPGPDHPAYGQIIRTYSETLGTVRPDHPALGRIIRPSAETFAVECFVSALSQELHLM